MLSHNNRIKLEKITKKIESGETVSFEEILFAQKLANINHSAAEILKSARRKSLQNNVENNELDILLQSMNIGEPDPSSYLTSESGIDDIVNFFKRNNTDDWTTRD